MNMAKTTNVSDLIELGRLAEQALNGKDFFVSHVSDRLRQASERHPHDQSIRAMQKLMDKKFAKEGSLALISQKEIQDVYNEVRGLGSSEVFKEEMGDMLYDASQAKVAHYNDDYVLSLRDHGSTLNLANEEMVSEFSGLFTNDPTVQKSAFIENGKNGVRLELLSMGFNNPSVEVAAKDSSFVIYAAEVDTVHGRTPFLIPAEVKLGSVLLPSVFVSGNEFVDFTKTNILRNAELLKQNGKTSTPKAVLATLNKLINKNNITRTASAEETGDAVPLSMLNGPGLYSDMVEDKLPDVDLQYQKVAMPEDLKDFSESFIKETLAEAGLTFSRSTVLKAKAMLDTELSALGIQHDKIVIASEWPKGVIFATNIRSASGVKTIEIPVEIANNSTVLMPDTFVSGTTVKAFNKNNLVAFATEKSTAEFNTVLSSYNDMSFKELYTSALKNAAFGNFVDAEECLAVIQDKFGSEFHKTAFNDLMELVRVGFNSVEESPIDAIDSYIKNAVANADFKENNVKISNTLMYVYPEDDRKKG